MHRVRKVLLPVVLVATMAVTACSIGETDQPQNGQVTVGGVAEDVSLDPNATNATDWLGVLTNMYDTLVTRGRDGQLSASLATEWKQTDPLTWQLTLRSGAKFHKGGEFSAHDAKFTLDRVLDPATKSPQQSYLASLAGVDAVDASTLRLRLKKQDPLIIQNLIFVPMVARDYVQTNGARALSDAVNGTGPFALKEWVKGDHLTMTANPDHWRGAPKVDTVVFRSYPESASLVAALQAGEVDIAVNVPPDSAKALDSASNFTIQSVDSSRSLFIVLDNMVKPLDDPKVRLALNLGTDKRSLTGDLLLGFATPLGNQLPTMYLGHNDALQAYPYDPDRAKQLLTEAGYPNGFKLTLNAPTGRYLKDKEIAEAISGQWRKIGIQVDLKLQEWGTYLNAYRAHTLGPAYLIGFGTPVWDSALGLNSYLLRANPQAYFRDPVLEQQVVQAGQITDNAQRAEALKKINKELYEKAAFVFLYAQKSIYGVSKRVEWQPRSDEMIYLYEARLR